MFLKRFLFINWGNIPTLEFEFGPVNLFSGGNGSGKTTAADAIQTVMTAAHENLFQYNPGQDETTQRGRGGKRVRTPSSYVLGCDDGSFARLVPTDGYLAGIFHPTSGETAEPFTALIGVRAWLDATGGTPVARQDGALYLILPGQELAMEELVREEQGQRRVFPLDRLTNELTKRLGRTGVERYDTKRGYLRRLYGALRGRDDGVPEAEAMAAARAFSRFMAYKPVQGIDRFVADEILERRDLGEAIRSVSSQLKTIHAMEAEATRLGESIEILGQAREQSRLYIDNWIESNLLDYIATRHEYAQREREQLDARRKQEEQHQRRGGFEEELVAVHQRGEQLHQRLVALEAQRLGIAELQQRDRLEQDRAKLDQALVAQAKGLLEQLDGLRGNLEASRDIVAALSEPELLTELPTFDLESLSLGRKLLERGGGDLQIHDLLQRDLTGDLAPLEQQLDRARDQQAIHNRWRSHWHGGEAAAGEGTKPDLTNPTETLPTSAKEGVLQSPRDALAELVQSRRHKRDQLALQQAAKRKEIERLQARRVNYPPHVERALEAIRGQCPEADPRVLCDHVEVTDPRWQAAIEGYLGGVRFAILVEAKHEATAIRIVRGLSGRDNRARVVQGDKAARDAERSRVEPDSLIQVLSFDHAVARAYLTASYGNVVRVESAEQLRNTRRGLTADGMASGGYSMWRCDMDDGELVFGAAARERALTAKEAELERIEAEWQASEEDAQRVQALLAAVDRLRPLEHGSRLAELLTMHREIGKLDALIERLELGEHQHFEEELAELRQREREYKQEEGGLNQQLGKLDKMGADLQRQLRLLDELQTGNREQVEQQAARIREIAAIWPDFMAEERLQLADQEAGEADPEQLLTLKSEAERRLHSAERRMGELLQRHNQHCRPADAIPYAGYDGAYDTPLFRAICALQGDIDRVFNILKNNILVEKHQQLRNLKASFNNAFVSHLCHAIYQAIQDGKRQIAQLNRELQHHSFGSDRETFRFASDWVPEYRDYARFFEEVVKNPIFDEAAGLFDAELSKRSTQVRDRIMEMLLDEDSDRALRELERIADYRNYHRYEIYKEVAGKEPIPLSEYGTGSGGQLETPAYIIRSAAVTSAFKFAEGRNHLRMVLVDEAFSKMDETRSREVIGYLTESLGLQLMFIMPTNKCGPFMDLISNEFVFAKIPAEQPRGQLTTRVLVDRRQCNQEKIKDLWAQHRRAVREQAEFDFMEAVLAEE
jgi:energy-coupling factor transporter ATP-binding protein EcfA2